MARLTKVEKETIILFNEGESTASIYTYNAGLKNGWQRSVKSILTCASWKSRSIWAVYPT